MRYRLHLSDETVYVFVSRLPLKDFVEEALAADYIFDTKAGRAIATAHIIRIEEEA